MAALPGGTVTLLFTDIEGSTTLLNALGEDYSDVLLLHQRLLRRSFEAHGGIEVDTQGDAFFVVFSRVADALAAAVAAQRALASALWPQGKPVRVRMGLHTGEPVLTGDHYVGIDVHRAARICASGHGGQVLFSQTVRELIGTHLPPGTDVEDLGEHRLKDLRQPEHVYQLSLEGHRSDWPPLRSLDIPTNLPAQLTAFVGRPRESKALGALLTTDGIHLATLTGPGGSGKTRLAVRVATEILEQFPDGVFFVPLAPVREPGLVASAIAAQLGLQDSGELPLGDLLVGHLRHKSMLLVLDNFEQILDAATLVSQLVTACPKLTVLATSRARLHLSGEHEYPVPPLEVPDARSLPPLADLGQYEAVRLFIERARAAAPDFAIDNDNAPAVAEICQRLDGLPLAIELAAARVKLLPPRAMLGRLESRLSLLTGGSRDAPARQRTLRHTLDWSYSLLEANEQVLLARLAIFVGGFTLSAAETICVTRGDIDVFEHLSSLVDKSLLRQSMEESADDPRFSMLETVREYALERLEDSGEIEALGQRHARYFLELAEAADPQLRGPDQIAWLTRLESELGNLRAALGWSLGDPGNEDRVETALRFTAALGWFWYTHGHLLEGCKWLEETLARSRERSDGLRARPLHVLGVLMDQRNEPQRAMALFEESLSLQRQLDSKPLMATSLNSYGVAARSAGDFSFAKKLWAESMELRRELGDRNGMSTTLGNLGVLAVDEGDVDAAESYLEESLAIDREHGDGWGEAINLCNLAVVALERDDHELASRRARRALELLHDLGDRDAIAECLETMTGVLNRTGEHTRATRMAGAAEVLRTSIGARRTAADERRFEAYLKPAREALSDTHFQAAWLQGGRMPLEAVIEDALATG